MELGIIERIQLLGILPAQGNVVTLRVVSDLRKALSFSEDEIKAAQIATNAETGRIMWNPDKAVVEDIEIGDTGLGIIRDALKMLDKTSKLTLDQMPIYDRFMTEDK